MDTNAAALRLWNTPSFHMGFARLLVVGKEFEATSDSFRMTFRETHWKAEVREAVTGIQQVVKETYKDLPEDLVLALKKLDSEVSAVQDSWSASNSLGGALRNMFNAAGVVLKRVQKLAGNPEVPKKYYK